MEDEFDINEEDLMAVMVSTPREDLASQAPEMQRSAGSVSICLEDLTGIKFTPEDTEEVAK